MSTTRPCARCGTTVRVSLIDRLVGGPVLCKDDDRFACDHRTMTHQERLSFASETEPPDPDSLPPEDLWVCPRCVGAGRVIASIDWQSGKPNFVACVWCGGKGDLEMIPS